MNYTMGRYIDEATDEMRDRLVQAEDFSAGPWIDGAGHCCLVGTAEDYKANPLGIATHYSYLQRDVEGADNRMWAGSLAAYRYHQAIERFGKARVVRAIKMRAASTTSVAAESRALEAVR